MFCFGVMFGSFVLWIPMLLFVGSLCVLMLGISFLPKGNIRFILLLGFVLLFGMFRYTQSEIPTGVRTVVFGTSHATNVEGIVGSEVERQNRVQSIVLKNVSFAKIPVYGNVLVKTPIDPELHYGDTIAFSCMFSKPEPLNGFLYDRYLAVKGIYAICEYPEFIDVVSTNTSFIGSVLSIKQLLNNRLDQFLTEPHSTFVSGLLFGGNSGLSKEIKTDFARTGTSHILAASGFNVSLFTFVFFGWVMETRLGKKRGAILTAILVVVYVIMAGMQAAVVRAALLSSVLLVGVFVERKASIINTLLLAAVLLLIINPRLLRDDVGFQLSFVAMIAILFLAPKWEPFVTFIPKILGLRDSIVGSVSVFIVSFPVLLWNFGSLSIIAPIANLFILPFVPYLMIFTGFALFVSFISISIAQFVSLPVWVGSRFILEINAIFSSLPFASISVVHARIFAITSFVFLIVFFLFLYEPARKTIFKKISF